MPQQVALICTTERIDGYTDAGTGTDLFAINISTALVAPVLNGLTAVQDLLQPWNWKPAGAAGLLQVTVWSQTDPAEITTGSGATVSCVPSPTLGPGAAKALTDSLSAQLTSAVALDPALLTFDNLNPGTQTLTAAKPSLQQPWPHLLAHASTYPAPVPQALNLVLFFRIPTPARNVVKLYAAPQFQANGVTCDATQCHPDPAPTPPTPPPAPPDAIPSGTVWTYPHPDATLPQVAVYQPPCDPHAAPQAVWIEAEPETGNQDWRTNLDQRLPDSFDLAQRSLDALRALTPVQITTIFGFDADEPYPSDAVRAVLDVLRIAILSVLRDTADFGLRYAPDGGNLLQFVLRSIGTSETDISSIESALNDKEKGYDIPTWTQNVLQPLFPGLLLLNTIQNNQAKTDASGRVLTPEVFSAWPQSQANLNNLVALLESLQTKLADDATLAQYIFQGWTSALDPLNLKEWAAIRRSTKDRLTVLSTSHTLRKRMLQANIGGPDNNMATWKQITQVPSGAGTDTQKLTTNLTDLLPAFLASRFNQQPVVAPTIDNSKRKPAITDASAAFPNWQQLLTAINTSTKAKAADFASDLFPSAPMPSNLPQPLIIKIHDATDDVLDAADPLRQMSGIGVLLKQDDATDWSSLNIASLYVNTSQSADPSTTPPPAPTYVLAAKNVFAPYRLSIRNGIVQKAISYDNEPLIAQSPLTAMASEVVAGSNQGTHANPLFQFRYGPDPVALTDNTTLDAWAHIYGLKFGKSYNFLPFRLTNSGALPKELTDGVHPWQLATVPGSFKPPAAPAPPAAPYLRRVPIRHPRVPFAAADAPKGTLPPIPASVFPLARALPKPATPAPIPPPLENAPGKDVPLLLLWNTPNPAQVPHASYTFTVRPPQIDLETWDRWVSFAPDPDAPPAPPPPAPMPPFPTLRNTRAAVHADSVSAAKKSIAEGLSIADQTSLSNPPKSIDTSIDDPGVSYLEFRLTAISTTAKQAPADLVLTIPGPQKIAAGFAYLDGFAQVQSPCYTVTVSIGASITMKQLPASQNVTLTLPEGDVWQLTINSLVTPGSMTRFENFSDPIINQFGVDAKPVTVTDPSIGPVQVYRVQAAARQLLIEAAMPLAPADVSEVLWKSVKLKFDSARMLTANLDPTLLARPDLFYKVDVTHQVWRWMGRPFPDGSFSSDFGTAADLNADAILPKALNWEAQAFAERSLTDVHTQSSYVNCPMYLLCTQDATGAITPAPQPTPQQPPPPPLALTQYDLSTDPRAHYYLFSVTLHSRYEGLPDFYGGQSIVSSKALPADATSKPRTPWNRKFLPALASSTPPPKPKILLCIPLTEPLDPASCDTRTNLLVIADEPWFQVGGLAEKLNAKIQFAPDPTVPLYQSGAGVPIPEFGPDPTLFADGFPWVQTDKQQDTLIFPATGAPIGTTFDDLSAAPLFANTCFHFELPDSNGKQFPFDWYMVKLSFTRALDPSFTTPPTGVVLESAATDAVWVQILPSSYHFRYSIGATEQPGPLSVTQLKFQPAGQGIQFLLGTDKVNVLAGPAGVPVSKQPPQLEIWVMLMQQITDAAGKPGEAYRGLFRADPATGVFKPITKTNIGNVPAGYTPSSNDVVYLLEVQKDFRMADITEGVPAALFSPSISTSNPDSEITHRIVRLSSRIANA
jgi:hypothetical protein